MAKYFKARINHLAYPNIADKITQQMEQGYSYAHIIDSLLSQLEVLLHYQTSTEAQMTSTEAQTDPLAGLDLGDGWEWYYRHSIGTV